METLTKHPFVISLSRYLSIIFYKTYANLKSENDKTYLGCLWWVIEPLINTVVFYFVFTQILKIREENYTVFLYLGMVTYGYFSTAIQAGANSIVQHAAIMQQIYLPKFVYVLITLSNASWKFLFSLLILFPLLWLHNMEISWAYLALPILLFIQIWLVIGITMPLAAYIPYFQDGKTVLSSLLSMGMWFSGVFYSVEKVPTQLVTVFYCNPAAVLIEAYRSVLLKGQWPEWSHFRYIVPVGIIFWILGLQALKFIDRKVPKLNM